MIPAQPSPRPTRAVAWTWWPLRDRWPGSMLAPLAIAAAVAAVHLSFSSALFDALAFVLLCASLLKYLAPTACRADADGIAVTFLHRRRCYGWESFEGCRDVPDGLMLKLRTQGGGEPRECFLPVPAGCDEAKDYVRTRVG